MLVDVQTISIVIAATSVVIGVINSILSNRRAEQNRQIELENRQIETFMRITDRFDIMDYAEVTNIQKWTDFDEYIEKYGPGTNPQAYKSLIDLLRHYTNLGILVKRNILDISLVCEQEIRAPHVVWRTIQPLVKVWRERYNPRAQEMFEYLINEMTKYELQQYGTTFS
ncbi:MAG: hypothetical protein JSV20_02135 [Candidatus Bathyarchaeota archaeon]|nr:MAG: hypothetical protein JSV20_02135 [Candidatus Bathyarchaeota archaeon]